MYGLGINEDIVLTAWFCLNSHSNFPEWKNIRYYLNDILFVSIFILPFLKWKDKDAV